MSENSENSPEPLSELIVCPSCLHENQLYVDYCESCGAPISPTVNFDPYKRIASQGWLFRKTASEPRRLISVIAMWLIFTPMLIFPIYLSTWAFVVNKAHPIVFVFILIYGFIPVAILWRTTKNYIRWRRELRTPIKDNSNKQAEQSAPKDGMV